MIQKSFLEWLICLVVKRVSIVYVLMSMIFKMLFTKSLEKPDRLSKMTMKNAKKKEMSIFFHHSTDVIRGNFRIESQRMSIWKNFFNVINLEKMMSIIKSHISFYSKWSSTGLFWTRRWTIDVLFVLFHLDFYWFFTVRGVFLMKCKVNFFHILTIRRLCRINRRA